MTLLFRCCFLPVIFYALNYLEVKTRRSRQHLLLPPTMNSYRMMYNRLVLNRYCSWEGRRTQFFLGDRALTSVCPKPL